MPFSCAAEATWPGATAIRALRAAVVIVLALGVALVAAPASASHDVTPARVEGPDRVATAVAAAQLAYPAGASTVLLARAGDWPDALAGAALAGQIDAPILLTGQDTVPPATQQALQELGAESVILLGGTAAISAEIEDGLGERYDVQRLAGGDRYATAAAVAREVAERGSIGATPGGMRTAFLASGTTFADALTAGAPAALEPNAFPLLLTAPDALPASTSAALADLPVEQVIIVGGTAVVSSAVQQVLTEQGYNVVRFGGATRNVTSTEVADFAVDILSATPEVVHLARGDAFPDALAAGPLAAHLGGPLLLTEGPDALGDPAQQWLEDRCPEVQVVRAVGGTVAISTAVLEQAEQAAQSCHPLSTSAVQLSYLSRAGNPLSLRLTDLAASDPTVVVDDVLPGGGYDVSPDGTEVVYPRAVPDELGRSDLVLAALDGSLQTVLTSGFDDRYPVVSPDGSQIAFTRGPVQEPGGGLYVVDRAGGEPRQLVEEPGAEAFFPRWSPDGSQIAYQRLAAGAAHVAVVPAAGGASDVITQGQLTSAILPAWSPDGELLAVVGQTAPDPGPESHLYVLAPDGTGLQQLTESEVEGLDPAWSPDGQSIAFALRADEVATSDLAVIDRDGSNQRVLADVRTLDGDPTWSPDGGTIAFVAGFTEGASDIYAVLPDGTGLRPLTDTGNVDRPAFLPDTGQ